MHASTVARRQSATDSIRSMLVAGARWPASGIRHAIAALNATPAPPRDGRLEAERPCVWWLLHAR